jgi:hypothetical protein
MVANDIGYLRPVSMLNIITHLDGLPVDSVAFYSGQLGPSTATGEAWLAFSKNGSWLYWGNVENSGFEGLNYLFVLSVPSHTDANGKVVAFVQTGQLGGTISTSGRSRSDSWQMADFDPLIVQQWDRIRSDRVQGHLHVSTVGWDVVVTVAAILALPVAGIVLATSGGNVHCDQPQVVPSEGGGAGVDVQMGCHYQ